MMLSTLAQFAPRRRSLWAVALLLVVFCCSGATCNRSFRSPFTPAGPPAPEVLMQGASLDQIMAAVNQNAAKVQSYQTNNATITIPGDAITPALRGNIAAMPPNKFRLTASTAITGPEVDLGSNDELFWFWVKRNDPPHVYFSRHDQFVGSAAQQLLPIEPRWLLDALGFMQFSPTDLHEGPVPRANGTVEIRSVIQSRIGTLTRNAVVDARRAWVLEQHIYDARGTLLASAVSRSHQYYPTLGVSMPQEIELNLPLAHMALAIDVGTVQLNQLADNPALWQLPVLSGYQQINLGTAAPNTISAMGAPGSNDWNTGAAPGWLGIEPPAGAMAGYDNRPVASYVMPPVTQTSATTPLVTPNAASQPVSTQTQSLPVGGLPVELKQ